MIIRYLLVKFILKLCDNLSYTVQQILTYYLFLRLHCVSPIDFWELKKENIVKLFLPSSS